MPEYQFADSKGEIFSADYKNVREHTNDDVQGCLREAFALFPYKTEIVPDKNYGEVFCVSYPEGDFKPIYICGKKTTPGGREGIANEQRIQPQAESVKYVWDKQKEGNTGILLGVYSYDGQNVLCAWRVTESNATSSVSKQIKIDSIAKAIKEGFVRQSRARGEFVCAFRPEFLYFYLNNCDWLHAGHVSGPSNLEGAESDSQQGDGLVLSTGVAPEYSRNRIVFGAPGTGKSYMIKRECAELIGDGNETNYERVTFHPDYSYANFVGTYKPVMVQNRPEKILDSDSEQTPASEALATCADTGTAGADAGDIAYKYVPGPFMRVYVKALKSARSDNPEPYLLIIEEINRANVAAVFGDIFQLLDRGDDGVSEYPIQASEDIKKYLASELGCEPSEVERIRIPDNMFIWATMNSADQGVFPVDTAFKRRWDFTYLGIDDNDEAIRGKYVSVGSKPSQRVEWNSLRKAINDFLAEERINEDKQLGPYFIAKNIAVPADGTDQIDSEEFCRVFKNKVLMYLFDDAAKQKRAKLFEGIPEGQTRYSKICEAFDKRGIEIFHPSIQEATRLAAAEPNRSEEDEEE